jgi:hypothetical protein
VLIAAQCKVFHNFEDTFPDIVEYNMQGNEESLLLNLAEEEIAKQFPKERT